VDCPTYEASRFGDVPLVDATASYDAESGQVSIFAVNRHLSEPGRLTLDLRAFGGAFEVTEAWTLTDEDLRATNTADLPDRVSPRPISGLSVEDGQLIVELPRVSWNAVALRPRLR
jgi:alpha-N-arabinofuranosidase